jgi:CheY-like chemotaxis protein
MANHLNVLVVEVDPVATFEALLLGLENHLVHIASDGPAALREIENAKPDVVLLDLALPGCDGLEVARRIHQLNLSKRPWLVAVTGRSDEEDFRRSQAAGIDMHLVKPVAPETLCTLLREFQNVPH